MKGDAYVYILSDYEEDGSRNVFATLDRAALPAMLDAMLDRFRKNNPNLLHIDEDIGGLHKLLLQSDEELSRLSDGDIGPHGHNLTRGWGGIQLHVVRIWEKGL